MRMKSISMHTEITLQSPSTAPKPITTPDEDTPRESNVVPRGGPTILAMENKPCSNPNIAPRSSGGTVPVVSVVNDVACM
mmetsp:Transcript_7297/g.10960  ORF Transcript_7297/g.10960 Transcript_7297/m.10960 type:complete len:80 (+) Transcript_7297:187-426(+)